MLFEECRKYGSVIKVFADQGSSKGDVTWSPFQVYNNLFEGLGEVRRRHQRIQLPASFGQATCCSSFHLE